jgi:hypothetical protein
MKREECGRQYFNIPVANIEPQMSIGTVVFAETTNYAITK